MNTLIGLGGTLAILLLLGLAIGAADRKRFAGRWFAVAMLLVAMNDALLTRIFHVLPNVIGGTWAWQGKLLALGATLAVAALPAFGWRRCGLTLRQEPGSLRTAIPVAIVYGAVFVVIALVFPDDKTNVETVAFQLTMPGFEEEPFYRGILLVALDRAFLGRRRFLGVDWGWGAALSCVVFGLAHALRFSHGGFSFDPMTMAVTAIPSLGAVWIRLRTGSLLIPVLLHNFGNSISLLV